MRKRKKKPSCDRGQQCKRWFRLVSILLYGGEMKQIDLAAELRTSTKTINRDMQALESLGLPIERHRRPTPEAHPGFLSYRANVDDFNAWLETICNERT